MLITVRCPLRTRVRRGHGVMRDVCDVRDTGLTDSTKGHALVASERKERSP